MHVPGDEFPAINEIELPFTKPLTGVQFLNELMEPLLTTEVGTPEIIVSAKPVER